MPSAVDTKRASLISALGLSAVQGAAMSITDLENIYWAAGGGSADPLRRVTNANWSKWRTALAAQKAGPGGSSVVRFSATKFLQTAAFLAALPQPSTVFIVCNFPSTLKFAYDGSSVGNRWALFSNGGLVVMHAGTSNLPSTPVDWRSLRPRSRAYFNSSLGGC